MQRQNPNLKKGSLTYQPKCKLHIVSLLVSIYAATEKNVILPWYNIECRHLMGNGIFFLIRI